MINELVKKLRKAADALDDLLESIPSNNHKAVAKIHKAMDKGYNKGKKKHWTKLPKNKAKVKKLLKKMRNAKKVKVTNV